ncbi:UNKNOWN [Stylonychia lemnae]|uniref:Uncharacterized protein n=1 Tax=Stylonychia lemnae TaxID=5949 RepID=A0A078B4Q1_STYLE|nr:UNKNOWN [Stylonychia lemnae]|eukprot:CDW88493.1 UNKNOWN [Stylonychia lemnae]
MSSALDQLKKLFCSAGAYQYGLKLFSCPQQSNCGTFDTLTPSSYSTQFSIKLDQQATPKLTKDSVCYYKVQFPNTATKGDVIYVNLAIVQNVKVYFYLGESITSSYVVNCSPTAGDTLIAEYPNQIFMTFVSTSNDNSPYYQATVQLAKYKQYDYQNDIRCTGVSNVKPSSGVDSGSSDGSSNTSNQTSNINYKGTVMLTLASSSQRQGYEDAAYSRSDLSIIPQVQDQSMNQPNGRRSNRSIDGSSNTQANITQNTNQNNIAGIQSQIHDIQHQRNRSTINRVLPTDQFQHVSNQTRANLNDSNDELFNENVPTLQANDNGRDIVEEELDLMEHVTNANTQSNNLRPLYVMGVSSNVGFANRDLQQSSIPIQINSQRAERNNSQAQFINNNDRQQQNHNQTQSMQNQAMLLIGDQNNQLQNRTNASENTDQRQQQQLQQIQRRNNRQTERQLNIMQQTGANLMQQNNGVRYQ